MNAICPEHSIVLQPHVSQVEPLSVTPSRRSSTPCGVGSRVSDPRYRSGRVASNSDSDTISDCDMTPNWMCLIALGASSWRTSQSWTCEPKPRGSIALRGMRPREPSERTRAKSFCCSASGGGVSFASFASAAGFAAPAAIAIASSSAAREAARAESKGGGATDELG